MVAYLYAIRLQAVNKFAGWGPAIISILGSFLLWSLLLLPQPAAVSPGLRLVGFCLVLGGNGFALYILYYLGQSFSILPESRELVTKGPYRYVRHPLYVAEAFSTIGVMIHFLSPAAAAIVAVQFVMQFIRIHYEEKVLRETFPDYAAYSRRTARLIPGIY
jgi:protein-S-isoprenylcysteine O-methyltransferase Ste14